MECLSLLGRTVDIASHRRRTPTNSCPLRENGINLDEVRTSSNGYYYADPKLDQADKAIKSMTSQEPTYLGRPMKREKSPTDEPSVVSESEATAKGDEETDGSYKRTLSGALQNPRADVPQKIIAEGIKSERKTRSYQLGNQLSMKSCTGTGPRIGVYCRLSSGTQNASTGSFHPYSF